MTDESKDKTIKLFLCGDVMTGRGIDQIMLHPGDPILHEPYMKNANRYVELTEAETGPLPRSVDFTYIWGDALSELKRMAPDVRIINLETSITGSDQFWKGKEVHYRMHPDNAPCLTAAKIDACSLANNHVLDWGYPGLEETLDTLKRVNIKTAGAGLNLNEAGGVAAMDVKEKGRVLLFSFGSTSSGVPSAWAAGKDTPGVNLLRDFSEKTVKRIRDRVFEVKQPGDVVTASIHWGGNWGYEIPMVHRDFVQDLIDRAGVDLVHGHSSHHVKGIEVYKGKLILYGCGDFITDYEAIGGYEEFRSDLGLMYFVSVNAATGELISLTMMPTQVRHFRINRASQSDALWLRDVLNREGQRFGTRVEPDHDGTLTLKWD